MERFTVTDAVLHRTFDAGTLARGTRYAATGAVVGLDVDELGPAGAVLRGRVQGSARRPYSVSVVAIGGQIHSQCTCPVASDCKHAVAVLKTYRTASSLRPVAPTPAWQRTLDRLLEGVERDEPVTQGHRKLGLRFELPLPTRRQWRGSDTSHLWVRPVREGARDNWIKTGISWATAEAWQFDQEHDAEQLAVLARFARAFPHGVPRDMVDLSAIGAQFFDVIVEAQDAGIALVGGERISSVEIATDPVEVGLDVVESADGARMQVGVWHEDTFVTGSDLHLLGRHPHSVGLVRSVRVNTTAAHPRVRLLLARLGARVGEQVAHLHRQGGYLDVPQHDREQFERDYVPRLRQQFAVISTDGSTQLEEEKPPRLQVLVTWEDLDVQLSWQWAYPDGSTFALGSRERAPRVRRPALERRMLGAVEEFADLQPDRLLIGLAAVEFARNQLPAMRAHEGVEVIEAGTAPDFRESVGEASIEFVAGSDDDATDWFDLSVVITVDGVQIPLADVLSALTLGESHVMGPGGLMVATDRAEFHRLAELVEAAAEIRQGDRGGLQVAARDLGMWNDLAELGVVDEQAAQWVRAAQALVGHETLPEVDPVGLTTTLRSYQWEGVRWLVHLWSLGLGGILADDMGLGKTLQTLALISHARAQGSGPFLVVAPTSVMTAWAGEAARHAPDLDVRVIEASHTRRGTALAEEVAGADLVVTSYTLLRLEADDYARLTWGGVVLDEAQAIKNHQSKTYQAVRHLDAPFRLAVTGTPFENRLLELWALLSVVAPGLYPSSKQFVEVVVRPVERTGDEAALARFRSRVRPFVLRRTKEVVAADLPAKQEQVLEVALHPKHQKLYDTWLQRERQSILGLVDDFDRNRVAIFSALTRLRQLSLDAALVDEEHETLGSAKLDVLVEHLVELAAEGHRALVFSQFTSFLKRARARLETEGVSCRYLDGATRRRGEEIDAFKSGQDDAFLISLKAGGVGLTLTEADYVFVLDPWWNPAAEAQAVDRAHRIGQQRPVIVYRLVSVGTIEEKVMALKDRKAALFASVFSGEGTVGTGIDADDVRALFD